MPTNAPSTRAHTTRAVRRASLETVERLTAAGGVLVLFVAPWQGATLLLVAWWCSLALHKLDRRRRHR